MVWFLGQDSSEMYDYGGIDALDGDWQKVQPLNVGRDGIRTKATCSNQGCALNSTFADADAGERPEAQAGGHAAHLQRAPSVRGQRLTAESIF